MTHGSISRLLTVALMVAFQASAVMTLGFSQNSSDCECDGGSWMQDMRCFNTEENATTFCSNANYNCRSSNTNRVGKVHKLLRVQNPPTPCPLPP
jgi:hypothetical protein